MFAGVAHFFFFSFDALKIAALCEDLKMKMLQSKDKIAPFGWACSLLLVFPIQCSKKCGSIL